MVSLCFKNDPKKEEEKMMIINGREKGKMKKKKRNFQRERKQNHPAKYGKLLATFTVLWKDNLQTITFIFA